MGEPTEEELRLRGAVLDLEARLARATEQVQSIARLEQTAKRRERRFRTIFEHSNDSTFLVDVERDEILDANARACRMLGYTREELLALPMSAIHPQEMDRVARFAEEVFRDGSGFTDELTCLTKGGSLLAAEMSAAIVELEDRTCMIASVRNVTEHERLVRENACLKDEICRELHYGSIVGRSAAVMEVLAQIDVVAPTEASVLITGESGTGKELVARAIHSNSARKDSRLVRVNCASIPRELFESEFFGHVKGAFTGAVDDRPGRFELADGGTLLLDEVGEIPLALQSKLLRVLQDGQFERVGDARTRRVEVRIIAATNRDLLAECDAGRFRQDLYYRLSVFPVHVPPLRERLDDVRLLVDHFVALACERLGREVPDVAEAQYRLLESYGWPGNVRELSNVVERAVIVSPGPRLTFDLSSLPHAEAAPAAPVRRDTKDLTLDDVKRLERDVVREALEGTGWKIYGDDGAAARLGIKPTTLSSRMRKMGLRKSDLGT